jgi:hypothetical protein
VAAMTQHIQIFGRCLGASHDSFILSLFRGLFIIFASGSIVANLGSVGCIRLNLIVD